MDKVLESFFVVIMFCVLLVVVGLLVAIPTWLLWNALIPTISNGALPEITLIQAFGLNILCSILFKSHNVNQSK